MKKKKVGNPTWISPIGKVIRRKDKLPLIITGMTPDGRYWTRQNTPTVCGEYFTKNFPHKKIKEGAVFETSYLGGKVKLVKFHPHGKHGYWDVKFLNDYKARQVASRHEKGSVGRGKKSFKEALPN